MEPTSPNVRDILEQSRRDKAAADVLKLEISRLEEAVGRAEDHVATLRERREVELEDVRALNRLSPATIVAKMSGSFSDRLDQEQAEVEAVEYEISRAVDTHVRLSEELSQARGKLRDLDAAGPTYEQALQAVAETSDPAGSRDAGRARQELVAARERAQLDRGLELAQRALDALSAAGSSFDSAMRLSTWDIFVGGWETSLAKRVVLDEAQADMDLARDRCDDLLRVVADLEDPGIDVPEFSALLVGLDIFGDNLLTDLVMRRRIKQAIGARDAAFGKVASLRDHLLNHRSALDIDTTD